MKTKTKQLVTNSLLLAVGFLLHYVTPAIGLPMQIDFSLITLILIITLNKSSFSTCLASGLATGIFSGITTKFPFGLVPNIIDKITTAIVVYLLIKLLDKTALNSKIKTIVVNAIGTLVSGTVFLASALLFTGLPAPFFVLFTTVVIPAIAVNTIVGSIVDNVCEKHRRWKKMNEKDMSNVVNRLIEATNKLDRLTNTFSKNINRMIICIITMLLILAVFVIAIVF